MKNFIKFNINNIKGVKSGVSIQPQRNRSVGQKQYSPPKNASINNRLSELEQKLSEITQNSQQEIIEQLSIIKEDIRLIKSHIFESKYYPNQKQVTQQSAADEDYGNGSVKQRMRSQSSEQRESKVFERSPNSGKVVGLQDLIQTRIKKSHSNYNKNSINFKTISSMIKQYKIQQGPQYGNVFFGYSKRNSQQIAVKYSPDGLSYVLQIYDRLWKNIAKAKWPCVNRILDFKTEDSSYMIMQKNKGNIVGLPPKPILIDILKIMEFIHDCGYLYRNIEPEHFMLNQDGQLVIIDFKRARRYIDIKGHPLQIIDSYNGSMFASNNQLRGLAESRKDDLESLGYFALLLLQMDIPWHGCTRDQTIKIRSGLTLQQLFKNHVRWVEYMAVVIKTPKGQRPDYKRLIEILQFS